MYATSKNKLVAIKSIDRQKKHRYSEVQQQLNNTSTDWFIDLAREFNISSDLASPARGRPLTHPLADNGPFTRLINYRH